MPISYALAEMEISNAILLNEIKSYFFLNFSDFIYSIHERVWNGIVIR